MAILKDLIVSGSSRLLGKLYTNDIEIGNDLTVTGVTTTTKLIVNTTVNQNKNSAVNSSTGNLAVIIGTPTGRHIAMDVDEIAAKNGVTTASDLWLNYGGGAVKLSTDAKIVANNGTLTAPTISNTTLTSTTSTITTANITTSNTNKINNADMITTSALDVKGKLHAVEYDLENIMDLGGSFVVAPTLIVPSSGSGTKTLTVTKSNNTTVVMTVRDPSITSGGIAGFAWANNYKVKVSGLVNNTVLGTCDGYINTTNVGSNTISLTVTMDAETVTAISTTVSTYKLNIMLYNTDTSSATAVTKPLGIYLQHYQLTNNPIINVWNGQTTTPKVRIGYLGGITYNGSSLGTNAQNSWGLYSDSVFLEGQIIANGGKIGGYSIGTSNLTKGTTQDASGSFWLTPEGQSATMSNLSSSAQTWAMTVGQNFGVTTAGSLYTISGHIGGFDMNSEMLNSGTPGTSGSVFMTKAYHGTTSIGGGSSDSWRIGAGTSFGVTNTGTLYCNDIQASGGKIGGLAIDTTSIHTYNVAVTSNADNSIALSSADFTRTISGTSRTGLRFAIGDKFGVTGDGAIYASSATISGAITATSGSFTGGILLNGGYLTTNSSRTTYNSTSATGITIDKNGIGGYASANAYFNMTTGGVLTAVGATITGAITATSFSAKDSNSKERATVNTNGFIVKDASGNTVASLSNDLVIGQVVANRYNVFVDADSGVLIRKNTTNLSKFDGSGVYFYDGSTIASQFTSDGAVIGKTSSNHIALASNQFQLKNNGTVLADFGSTITLGQTSGQAAVISSTNGMQVYKGGTQIAKFSNSVVLGNPQHPSFEIIDENTMTIREDPVVYNFAVTAANKSYSLTWDTAFPISEIVEITCHAFNISGSMWSTSQELDITLTPSSPSYTNAENFTDHSLRYTNTSTSVVIILANTKAGSTWRGVISKISIAYKTTSQDASRVRFGFYSENNYGKPLEMGGGTSTKATNTFSVDWFGNILPVMSTALIQASDYTITTTASGVTVPIPCRDTFIVGDCFEEITISSTNRQILILKTGYYSLYVDAVWSSISSTNGVKRTCAYLHKSGGSELSIGTNALGRPATWEIISAESIVYLEEGDEIRMDGGSEGGNATLYSGKIILRPVWLLSKVPVITSS